MTHIENRKISRGYTLIELLIVITIIGILASIAAPTYQRSLIKAREAVLLEDLYQMRKAIDGFYADNLRYPDSLQEMVETRYLRSIPQDPFTKSAETWETVAPEFSAEGALPPGNVFDVHSGSDLIGLNGIPLKEW